MFQKVFETFPKLFVQNFAIHAFDSLCSLENVVLHSFISEWNHAEKYPKLSSVTQLNDDGSV